MKQYLNLIFILPCVFYYGCSNMSMESKINSIEQNTNVISDDEESFKKANYFEASKINAQLGVYYLDKGHYKRAKEKLLLSMKQYSEYGPNLTAMAYYYEKTGDPKLADNYYQRALKLAGNDGVVLNNYGTFVCRQGDYKKAIDLFKKAVQDQSYLNAGEAYENAAMCAENIPDINLAKHYYEKALQKNPSLYNAIYQLATLNYNQKKFKAARKYLNNYEKYSGKNDLNYVYLDNLLSKAKV